MVTAWICFFQEGEAAFAEPLVALSDRRLRLRISSMISGGMITSATQRR